MIQLTILGDCMGRRRTAEKMVELFLEDDSSNPDPVFNVVAK